MMLEGDMILEGIVTTLNDDATVNISPMGPEVDASMSAFILKPYQTSNTYRNLKQRGEGVLHVTDDVLLIARAAINCFDEPPSTYRADSVAGAILCDACRWYAFRVEEMDEKEARTKISCRVVDHGRHRDFFGFNRAKHAVLEAAILATRVEFLPHEEIVADMSKLRVIVEKTAGENEHQAFVLLDEHITDCYRRRD